jgi:hypothetical protein
MHNGGYGVGVSCHERTSRSVHQRLFEEYRPCRRVIALEPMELLLMHYENPGLNAMLVGFPTKDATAICTFAYSPGPGQEPVLFVGETEGEIVQPRGSTHFGWDVVFQVKVNGQT